MPIETDQQYLKRVVKEQAEEIERLEKEIEYLMGFSDDKIMEEG